MLRKFGKIKNIVSSLIKLLVLEKVVIAHKNVIYVYINPFSGHLWKESLLPVLNHRAGSMKHSLSLLGCPRWEQMPVSVTPEFSVNTLEVLPFSLRWRDRPCRPLSCGGGWEPLQPCSTPPKKSSLSLSLAAFWKVEEAGTSPAQQKSLCAPACIAHHHVTS